MKDKSYRSQTYRNFNLLETLITELQIPQLPFKPQLKSGQPQNYNLSPQVITKSTTDLIPESLKTQYKIPEEVVQSLFIYKVNTNRSLLHSLLCLLDTSYKILPWEYQENLVTHFKNKVIYDLDQKMDLQKKLKCLKIRKADIKTDLTKELPTENLKIFMCLYFDINLIILTSQKLEYAYPEEALDIYKSTLFLYQYPYGNLAPILQENQTEQILIYSQSDLLQFLVSPETIPSKYRKNFKILLKNLKQKEKKKEQGDEKEQGEENEKEQGDENEKEQGGEKEQEKGDENEQEKGDENEKEKGDEKEQGEKQGDEKEQGEKQGDENEKGEKQGDEKEEEKKLMKMTLAELQTLSRQYQIDIKKPSAQKNKTKNKTKKELCQDLIKLLI